MTARLKPGEWETIDVKRRGDKWRARAYVRLLDGTRRHPERKGATKKEAKARLEAHLKSITTPPPKKKKLKARDRLFGEFLDEFLENIKAESAKEGTVGEYNRAVTQIREAPQRDEEFNPIEGPTLGQLKMKHVTHDALRNHLRFIAEKHPTKAKKHRTVLAQAYGVAMSKDESLKKNLVSLVRGVKTPEVKRTEAASIDDMKALRNQALLWRQRKIDTYKRGLHPTDPRSGPSVLLVLIDVMLATGLRIGEVLSLRWCDIDLENRTLMVTGTIIDGAVRQSTPKSKSGFRVLRLPKFAADSLLDHKIRQGDNPIDAVFLSRSKTWRSTHNTHTLLRRFRAEMGIADLMDLDQEVTFKAFRKTVASEVRREHGARSTMLQLGHSNERIQDSYVGRPPEADDVSDLLEKAFGSGA